MKYLGYSRTGSFTQTGGTHTVNGTVYLGDGASTKGTYVLADGQLTAGTEYAGYSGGIGSIAQGGGYNSVGALILDNSGTYTLTGGTLTVIGQVTGHRASRR